MPNDKDYITSDLFEVFLSRNGFRGTEIISKFTEWKKGDILLKLPHEQVFTKNIVIELLNTADLSIKDLERFMDVSKVDGLFDALIDKSLNTPSLKHKKD